jgi:ketopantoate reductase PanE/ApbA-like protein
MRLLSWHTMMKRHRQAMVATALSSSRTPSRKSLPPGSARIMPIGARIRLVEAALDGQPVEADHVIGDLIARADTAKVPVPRLRTAYTHLRAYEQTRG